MPEPFVGEIRLFSFGVVPRGWAQCNGQLLTVQQNAALYSILGTSFGGNGSTTFGLPDLRGRVPLHPTDNNSSVGVKGGSEAHSLTVNEMPKHSHTVNGSQEGTTSNPADQLWGKGVDTNETTVNLYTQDTGSTVAMNPNALSEAGAGAAHPNMQPYLVANYCIALVGVYPSHD